MFRFNDGSLERIARYCNSSSLRHVILFISQVVKYVEGDDSVETADERIVRRFYFAPFERERERDAREIFLQAHA